MILDVIKIFLFMIFFNWTIAMHLVNTRVGSKSQKRNTVILALLFSLVTGIVITL